MILIMVVVLLMAMVKIKIKDIPVLKIFSSIKLSRDTACSLYYTNSC